MNNYTLKFNNQKLEKQYFFDQVDTLIDFYTWACVLATLSTIAIFVMEFITPFGFGDWKYCLLGIPLAFIASHKFVVKHSQYFNLILALMNMSLGIFCYVLLYIFAHSDILFLAGQTVAMIQYSLFLGSNFVINMIILSTNQIGLMIITSIVQQYINSLQIMFILSLILVMKSIWSSERMKRQFFLLKHQNIQLQKSLDNVFLLKIIECEFDSKLHQFKFLSSNQQAQQIVESQSDFTKFIREFREVKYSISKSINLISRPQLSSTLESILLQINSKDFKGKQLQISTRENHQNIYKLSIQKILKNDNHKIILLLQEDTQFQQIIKLKNKIKRQEKVHQFLFQGFKTAQMALINIQISIKKELKIVNFQKYKFLKHSTFNLYSTLFHYYNSMIYQQKFSQLGEIRQFTIVTLFQDIQKLSFIFDSNQHLDLFFENNTIIECETNYILLLQLILNILILQVQQRFKSIQITVHEFSQINVNILLFKIILQDMNFSIECLDQRQQQSIFKMTEIINHHILKKIGFKTEINCKTEEENIIISFEIIKNLNAFQTKFCY